MKDTEKAFLWITDILERNNITYKISGGFAARAYGVTRELADIDIEVSEKDIPFVAKETQAFIIFGPQQYKDDNWDLDLLTLNYEGQEIDIAAIEAKMFNQTTKQWESAPPANLADVTIMKIYGKQVPIEKIDSLIAYKSKLLREVDIEDIRQLQLILKETTIS